MLRAADYARVAHAVNAVERVLTSALERRRGRVLGLLVALLLLLYLLAVPSSNWPGLLPRADAPPPRPQVPAWPGSGSDMPESSSALPLLQELHANFTATWRRHARPGSAVPQPVYASPGLTRAQLARYRHLKRPHILRPSSDSASGGRLKFKGAVTAPPAKYMFAAVLKDVGPQLPDLLNTLAVATQFLGPEHVSFSILEGPSAEGDPSGAVLRDVLLPALLALGVPNSSIAITAAAAVPWAEVHRIEALAELRNKALQPLWDDNRKDEGEAQEASASSTVGTDVAAVVYFNDVFLQPADVLELLHQHVVASRRGAPTGITAAWDWYTRDPAYFYDVWVARTIEGDVFYPLDQPRWTPSDDILSTSPNSKAHFDALVPFQVFSAWNGIAVLNPAPFTQHGVAFRRSDRSKDECAASECTLLASDFWKVGFGRVQVVPAVQVAYERDVAYESAMRLREQMAGLGWVEGVPDRQHDAPVVFSPEPPPRVRCNPWPEAVGLGHEVWATTTWVPPYLS